jgi:glycosyltransferase involved in cell wall biosynthesis
MSRVLCFSYERLFHPDENLSGAGYRLYQVAMYLKKKKHQVTIAQRNHDADHERDGIRFIGWDPRSLKGIKKDFDCAYLPLSAYSNEYFSKIEKIPTLVDLSTPLPIEAELQSLGEKDDFLIHHGLSPLHSALAAGDKLVCSTLAQKKYYSGMLHLMGYRLTDKKIDVAPLCPEPGKILASKVKAKVIDAGKDRIALWLGSIFSWYDYKTPISAMKSVKKVKLVFAGALNPNVTELTRKNYEDAKRFAADQGVLGSKVIFIDWVDYSNVARLCEQADIAVTASLNAEESWLSYRLRYTDYLSARLPMICTSDDDFSATVLRRGLGLVVPPLDPKALGSAITAAIKNRKDYSENIDSFIKEEFNRDICFRPLDEFCKNPKLSNDYRPLDFYRVIDMQRDRIKDLEYIRDDKLATNATLTEEIKRYEARFNEVIEDKKSSERELKQNIANLNETVSRQNELIRKHSDLSGKFRGSIVYPLFRLTHSLGKTRLGSFIEKILK